MIYSRKLERVRRKGIARTCPPVLKSTCHSRMRSHSIRVKEKRESIGVYRFSLEAKITIW